MAMTRDDTSLLSFVTGAAIVLFLGTFLLNYSIPFKIYDRDKALIEACEKPLPRTEHCVIVAVPVSKD